MRTKIALASLAIIALAVGMLTDAAPIGQTVASISNAHHVAIRPESFAPKFDVLTIGTGSAATGNTESVIIYFELLKFNVSGDRWEVVRGLNASNFKVDTINVPPYGALVDVEWVDSDNYGYTIHLIPTTYQATQYVWTRGVYGLQLNYIKDGKRVNSCKLNFLISDPKPLSEEEQNLMTLLGNAFRPRGNYPN